jgi:serine/threonine-protein kinase RsbW
MTSACLPNNEKVVIVWAIPKLREAVQALLNRPQLLSAPFDRREGHCSHPLDRDPQILYTSIHPLEESHLVTAVERKFKRHIDSLANVFEFIEKFVSQENVDDDSKRAFDLAVDELFTNTVKYHPSNTNEVSIELQSENLTMTLILTDFDVDSFDLTKKVDPDLTGSLKDRTPGGLGIYLTKKVVDDVQYEYNNRTSVITLKKSFRRKDV